MLKEVLVLGKEEVRCKAELGALSRLCSRYQAADSCSVVVVTRNADAYPITPLADAYEALRHQVTFKSTQTRDGAVCFFFSVVAHNTWLC
jgi:hypothetical protein